MSLTLQPQPAEYAVCRLGPADPIPEWACAPGFLSITRTAEELSVICQADAVPAAAKHQRGWQLYRLAGTFAFSETGILARVLQPLAAAGISVLAVATYDTDYVLVPADKSSAAATAWRASGHTVENG